MPEYNEMEQLVGDVTNIDTARMTLRWSLERLNNVEKEKADLKKKLTISEEAKKTLDAKIGGLEQSLNSRLKIVGDKEAFYHKLEATMELLGQGKLNIEQLIKKEAKIEQIRKEFEDDYQDKFEELDKREKSLVENWSKRLLDVEELYGKRLGEAQSKYDSLRHNLNSDYQSRLTSLEQSFKEREKSQNERIFNLENFIKTNEISNQERRKDLEFEFLGRKKELEDTYEKIKSMLEQNFSARIASVDTEHHDQIRALENSWNAERQRLLREQEIRENQFIEAQKRIEIIENQLAAQQEEHQTKALSNITDREKRFAEKINVFKKEKASLNEIMQKLSDEFAAKEKVWLLEKAESNKKFTQKSIQIENEVREKYEELAGAEFKKMKEDAVNLKESLARAYSSLEGKKGDISKLIVDKLNLEEKLADILSDSNKENIENKTQYENNLSSLNRELELLREDESGNKELITHLNEKIEELTGNLNNALEDAKANVSDKLKLEEKLADILSDSSKESIENKTQYEVEVASLNREIELLKGDESGNKDLISRLNEKIEDLTVNVNSALENVKATTSDLKEKYKAELENEREKLLANTNILKEKLLKASDDKLKLEKGISNTITDLNKEILENKTKYEDEVASLILDSNREKLESRTHYENEMVMLNEQLNREIMSAKNKDASIKLLNEQNAEIIKNLELASLEIHEKEKAVEKRYALKKEELIKLHNNKIGYLNVELSSKFANEKKVWEIERERFNHIIEEFQDKYTLSQENVDKLASEKRDVSDEVFRLQAEFNDEVISIKSEYEKEMMADIEESVRMRTKGLREKLESTEKQNDEMVNLVKFKNDEISKLEDNINEKDRIWEGKVRNIERDLMARKIAKLQGDYDEKQTAIEEDALAYKAELDHEYKEKCRNVKEVSDSKINESIKEKEEFRIMVAELSQKLSQVSSKANVLEIKIHDGEKNHRNTLAELKKEHLIELEKKVSEAIEDHTSILISKLEMTEDQIIRFRQDNEREIKMLDDSFNNEKERMLDEIEKREKIVEAANAKIEELEDDLMDYRENSSKAVMNQLVDQEKKFALQLADFDKKQEEVEEEYGNRVHDIKNICEAKIDKMNQIVKDKNEFIAQREEDFKQREDEIDLREDTLRGKMDIFNGAMSEERMDLARREGAMEKKIQENDIEHARKINELERMKAELSRAIREYKGQSK